jgi:hypothetical protein
VPQPRCRPGQASAASAEPGPITTNVSHARRWAPIPFTTQIGGYGSWLSARQGLAWSGRRVERMRRRVFHHCRRVAGLQVLSAGGPWSALLEAASARIVAAEIARQAATIDGSEAMAEVLQRHLHFEIMDPLYSSAAFAHCRSGLPIEPSLRANGSRECAPDDRLREAIHLAAQRKNGLLRPSLAELGRTSRRKGSSQ